MKNLIQAKIRYFDSVSKQGVIRLDDGSCIDFEVVLKSNPFHDFKFESGQEVLIEIYEDSHFRAAIIKAVPKNQVQIEYSVSFVENNTAKIIKFSSFSAAAGFCSGDLSLTRYLNVDIKYKKGSSVSGSIYKYSKGQSEREALNQYLIKEATRWAN